MQTTKQITKPHQCCPIFLTIELIANKWGVCIIDILCKTDGYRMRFNEIKKAVSGITQAELTKQLKEFEKCGVIKRKVHSEMRIEYILTKLGISLGEPIEALSQWAKKNGRKVHNNIAKFNSSND